MWRNAFDKLVDIWDVVVDSWIFAVLFAIAYVVVVILICFIAGLWLGPCAAVAAFAACLLITGILEGM